MSETLSLPPSVATKEVKLAGPQKLTAGDGDDLDIPSLKKDFIDKSFTPRPKTLDEMMASKVNEAHLTDIFIRDSIDHFNTARREGRRIPPQDLTLINYSIMQYERRNQTLPAYMVDFVLNNYSTALEGYRPSDGQQYVWSWG